MTMLGNPLDKRILTHLQIQFRHLKPFFIFRILNSLCHYSKPYVYKYYIVIISLATGFCEISHINIILMYVF